MRNTQVFLGNAADLGVDAGARFVVVGLPVRYLALPRAASVSRAFLVLFRFATVATLARGRVGHVLAPALAPPAVGAQTVYLLRRRLDRHGNLNLAREKGVQPLRTPETWETSWGTHRRPAPARI